MARGSGLRGGGELFAGQPHTDWPEDRGRRHATATQAMTQCVSAPRKPAANGTHWPAQPRGGFVVGQPFQIAEDDWCAKFLGKPADLLVENLSPIVRLDRGLGLSRFDRRGGLCRHARAAVTNATADCGDPGTRSDPQRDSVKPACDRISVANCAGPVGQYQKNGLDSIMNIVRIIESLVADAQDHGPVPHHQNLECKLSGRVAAGDKPRQQLTIAQPGAGSGAEEHLERLAENSDCSAGHDCGFSDLLGSYLFHSAPEKVRAIQNSYRPAKKNYDPK